MNEAISNTSPLLYLYRIGVLERLQNLFGQVWVPSAVVLEAKSRGLTPSIAPHVDNLDKAGMWLSLDIRNRILTLAGES